MLKCRFWICWVGKILYLHQPCKFKFYNKSTVRAVFSVLSWTILQSCIRKKKLKFWRNQEMIQVPIHHFNFSDLSADTMMLWSAMLIFTSCDVNLEQKFEIKTSAIISNQRYPSSRFSLFLLVWSRVVDIILNIIFDRMWDTIPHCWHITQGQALHFTDRIQTTRDFW